MQLSNFDLTLELNSDTFINISNLCNTFTLISLGQTSKRYNSLVKKYLNSENYYPHHSKALALHYVKMLDPIESMKASRKSMIRNNIKIQMNNFSDQEIEQKVEEFYLENNKFDIITSSKIYSLLVRAMSFLSFQELQERYYTKFISKPIYLRFYGIKPICTNCTKEPFEFFLEEKKLKLAIQIVETELEQETASVKNYIKKLKLSDTLFKTSQIRQLKQKLSLLYEYKNYKILEVYKEFSFSELEVLDNPEVTEKDPLIFKITTFIQNELSSQEKAKNKKEELLQDLRAHFQNRPNPQFN